MKQKNDSYLVRAKALAVYLWSDDFLMRLIEAVMKPFVYLCVLALPCAVIGFLIFLVSLALSDVQEPQPPAMNAPLLEIVRWREPQARDEHQQFNGKTYTTTYTDNANKFVACMRGYEYEVTR